MDGKFVGYTLSFNKANRLNYQDTPTRAMGAGGAHLIAEHSFGGTSADGDLSCNWFGITEEQLLKLPVGAKQPMWSWSENAELNLYIVERVS